jgi:hypothetical protein
MSSQNVLDAGGRTQREIAALVQPRTARRDVAMYFAEVKDLASWENEGGAIPLSFVQPVTEAGQAAQGVRYQAFSEDVSPGADKGASDMLAIAQIYLLLLVPAIGASAIYWGLLVGSASQ